MGKVSNLSTKFKSGGIILSFITLSAIIIVIFRFLESRLKKSNMTETSEIDNINWADNIIGFQPKFIEEFIKNKEEVNNLIADLNTVINNGEEAATQKLQQQLILSIHKNPDPESSELKNKMSKLNFKNKWFLETDYQLQATQNNKGVYLPNIVKSNGYFGKGAHHNRLKPSAKNNFVTDVNDWKTEFTKETLDTNNNLKKRIFYTNNKSNKNTIFQKILANITDINIDSISKEVISFFNKDDYGLLDDILGNNEHELIDPYYRVLYEYDSSFGTTWPLYNDDKNTGAKKRLEVIDKDAESVNVNVKSFNCKQKSLRTSLQDNKEYSFFLDPITRISPIWPLTLPSQRKHKSNRPILKDKGSFEMINSESIKNIGRFFESTILITLLTKIHSKKKIVLGITFIYIILSLYILNYVYKKKPQIPTGGTLESKNGHDIKAAEKKKYVDDKQNNRLNKIKKIIIVLFPVTYYIIGLFGIVSYNRYKHGELAINETDLSDLKEQLKSSKSNVGKFLFTATHNKLLQSKLDSYTNGDILNMNMVGTISSGIGIFCISVLLYFVLKLFRMYPIESLIASLIVTFVSIVVIVIYLIYKYKDILLTFLPDGITFFGTGNMKEIVKMLSVLLSLILVFICFIFGNKINIRLSTNGKTLLEEETSLSTIKNLGINNNNSQFCISSWFYFVVSGSSSSTGYDGYIPFFNFNYNPIMLFNSRNGNVKVVFEDETYNEQVIFDGPVKIQKWNNILINYNGSDADIFINSKLVGTKNNIFIKSNLSNLIVGSQNKVKNSICYTNLTDTSKVDASSCSNADNTNTRCYYNKKIYCGDDACENGISEKKTYCDTNTLDYTIHGGMSRIVYYNNILKMEEIEKNYNVFKDTLKNKVY